MKISAIVGALAFLAAFNSQAGLHKCQDEKGKVTYSDRACKTDSAEKVVAGPNASQGTGPGPAVCESVRTLAGKIFNAMQAGVDPSDAIGALGGVGMVQHDVLQVLNYVYSFRGLTRLSKPQTMALTYEKCMAGGFNISPPPGVTPTRPANAGRSTGSGFLVNAGGGVLTNHHVVDGCRSIRVQRGDTFYPANLRHARAQLDLAVLQVDGLPGTPAIFSSSEDARLGERVVAAGFPLQGMLSRQVNVTSGIVSANAGIAEDKTVMQVTVPLQPGNSGGPVLDGSGLVKGVAVAKLAAAYTYQASGSLPENVNFAVKGAVARSFLSETGTPFETEASGEEATNEDIAERAQGFTVYIECQN